MASVHFHRLRVKNTSELSPREAAGSYLTGFYAPDMKKGMSYYRGGRVRQLTQSDNEVVAKVQGQRLYEVILSFDSELGWDGECSCPMEMDCKHCYAAMLAWMALPTSQHIVAEATAEFPAKVAKALDRTLTAAELKFFRTLRTIFQSYAIHKRISFHELSALGFHFRDHSWEPVRLCPHPVGNEEGLWLLIAEYLTRHNHPIPEFLVPVTRLDVLQQQAAAWRRKESVQQWQTTLQMYVPVVSGGGKSESWDVDLRLVLEPKSARLAWKSGDAPAFEPLTERRARQLAEEVWLDGSRLNGEVLVLWQMLMEIPRNYGRSNNEISYANPEDVRLLSRLLRQEKLRPFILGANGQPLEHRGEVLNWRMEPALNEDQDYALQLVRADGSLPPPPLVVTSGRPPLYVTATEVFPCRSIPSVLRPDQPNLIPAPALETGDGMRLLQQLGLDFPPRLQQRIRQVVLRPKVQCELKPLYPGSNTEKCLFKVRAFASEGLYQENWRGDHWSNPAMHRVPNDLTFYDRRLLDPMIASLAPLGLKLDMFATDSLMLKVTKKFPEIFIQWLKSLPTEVDLELKGELASFLEAGVVGSVKLAVSEVQIDWFDLQVMVDVSDTTLTPEEIKLLLNAKGSYVRLGKKGWKKLQFDLTQEEDEELAKLGLSPHSLSAEPQRLHALQLADKAAKRFLPEEQVQRVELRASEIKARVTPEVPATITADLRPYQKEGFHFLAYLSANNFGGVLADDMGLGKTVQTLAWIEHLRAQDEGPGLKPCASLVVCPKSVMDNWRAEAGKFASGIRVKVWPAAELENLPNALAEAELHVINYSQLRLLEGRLHAVRWLAVILDEGQFIKNPSSQTAQIARGLNARHRLILSGTPIENRLLDLWSLMAFAMPGILGSRAEFGRLYDAKNDPLARRRLSARVRPFLLRRTKSQVAKDLPDRVEEDLLCEMEGEQKSLYRAELKTAQQLLLKVKTQKELNKNRFNFLTSLLRLRQICCHPALVNAKCKTSGAKVEALLEQLEPLMEEGQKVLVFSQFVELIDLLGPMLKAHKWPVFQLTGATENRGDLVQEFQKTEGAAIFLLSLKAGGFGLNLTAASYVVLFDPWWNPAVERQAIDRTHRIGQTQKVMAYRLLIKDSIEEKIRALQKQKASLAEDVLGEEKFAQTLTVEDLRFLFAE
jgi:superfamily II DNA or RNA helicase